MRSKVTVCKTYHAEYTLDGRQRSKSLATKNKAAAQRAAHILCEQLRNGIDVKPVKKISVVDMKDAYLKAQIDKGRASTTVRKYRHDLTEFADWWQTRDGRPALKVTEQDFFAYRTWLKEEGKSEQTIEDRLIVVKQLFKWAWTKGKLLATNPLADATVPEAPVNQILYGDAVETLKSLPDDYVNLIFTSPPYPILGLKYGAYEYDGDYSKYLEWMGTVFAQCHRVLRDGGYLVLNFDNTYVQANERKFTIDRRRNVYADFDNLLGTAQMSFLDTVIWDKLAGVAFQPVARNERSSADVKCSPTFEFLNVYRKGEGPQKAQHGDKAPITDLTDEEWYDWRNKLWRIPAQRVKGNHRCPYPLELAERVVRLYSYRFDICLDPFVGSGTTAAAAVLHGRRYIGIDNDPLAVKDARERVEKSKAESLKTAASVSNYEPLPTKEKADDIARRLQTIQKHKRKQMQQAMRKETGRNRPVGVPAGTAQKPSGTPKAAA